VPAELFRKQAVEVVEFGRGRLNKRFYKVADWIPPPPFFFSLEFVDELSVTETGVKLITEV